MTPPRGRVARCTWADGDPLMERYHDEEWGVPVHDEHRLFELLTLEGAQAGLSWRTILHKRDGYRRAFAGFDPSVVARYGPADVERLLADPGIVRHRGKIEATIGNAGALLGLHDAGVTLDELAWAAVGGAPVVRLLDATDHLPAQTDESRALSKQLQGRGFRFVGPTTVYAFLQAGGMVDDHTASCFRRVRGPARSRR